MMSRKPSSAASAHSRRCLSLLRTATKYYRAPLSTPPPTPAKLASAFTNSGLSSGPCLAFGLARQATQSAGVCTGKDYFSRSGESHLDKHAPWPHIPAYIGCLRGLFDNNMQWGRNLNPAYRSVSSATGFQDLFSPLLQELLCSETPPHKSERSIHSRA